MKNNKSHYHCRYI